MRRIVESHPGHDVSFYNAMRLAHQQHLSVDDVFGSQSFFYKYPLVDAAKHCDNIFAVGDYIIDTSSHCSTQIESICESTLFPGVQHSTKVP